MVLVMLRFSFLYSDVVLYVRFEHCECYGRPSAVLQVQVGADGSKVGGASGLKRKREGAKLWLIATVYLGLVRRGSGWGRIVFAKRPWVRFWCTFTVEDIRRGSLDHALA
jgi:hypothetical protein